MTGIVNDTSSDLPSFDPSVELSRSRLRSSLSMTALMGLCRCWFLQTNASISLFWRIWEVRRKTTESLAPCKGKCSRIYPSVVLYEDFYCAKFKLHRFKGSNCVLGLINEFYYQINFLTRLNSKGVKGKEQRKSKIILKNGIFSGGG